jgi:hypothetical protein
MLTFCTLQTHVMRFCKSERKTKVRISDGSGYRPAPKALCTYERTARPAPIGGNAIEGIMDLWIKEQGHFSVY